MNKGKDRTVYPRPDGKWVNKRNDSQRVSGVYPTQQDAVREAKRSLMIEGGGKLTVIGADRRIHSKGTIPFGNDPFPPRDLEH